MTTATDAGVGLRGERGRVLIAIMVTTALVAIDATVVATAVPSIAQDVGGFSQSPWLYSIYLLAQAATVPVYSKLADTFGRKPIILIGVGLFLLGSVLSGFAWSMPALIAFRAVQGLGAGAVQPMSITIVGDIYSVAERAKTQGYIAGVWAVSSVVGPLLGGVFAQIDAWRWIFFINVPLCVLAAVLLMRDLHERVERRRHRIDIGGAILLTGGLVLLILAILEGGQGWSWDSWQSIGCFALAAVLLVAFGLVQTRAAEPVLPLWVLSDRLLATTSVIAFGIGAAMLGLSAYVPAYLQASLGLDPLPAGFGLAFLTIGWPIAATFSGRLLYLRYGFRTSIRVGAAIALVGALVIAVPAHQPVYALIAVGGFVMGLGMGFSAAPSLIAAQASATWDQRAVVTGANMLARSVGSAIGVAVFGAIANAVFARSGADEHDAAAMTEAGSQVFWGVVVAAVVIVVAAAAMPRTALHRDPQQDAAAAPAAPGAEGSAASG